MADFKSKFDVKVINEHGFAEYYMIFIDPRQWFKDLIERTQLDDGRYESTLVPGKEAELQRRLDYIFKTTLEYKNRTKEQREHDYQTKHTQRYMGDKVMAVINLTSRFECPMPKGWCDEISKKLVRNKVFVISDYLNINTLEQFIKMSPQDRFKKLLIEAKKEGLAKYNVYFKFNNLSDDVQLEAELAESDRLLAAT